MQELNTFSGYELALRDAALYGAGYLKVGEDGVIKYIARQEMVQEALELLLSDEEEEGPF